MADKWSVVLENDGMVVNFVEDVFVVVAEDVDKAFGTKKGLVNSFVVFPFVTFDCFVVDMVDHSDYIDSVDGYVACW